MDMGMIFTCEKCDSDMAVEDVSSTDVVTCHNCGREYTLRWVEAEESWDLTPVEATEEGSTDEGGEPFRVLNEPAALRDDDLDRY